MVSNVIAALAGPLKPPPVLLELLLLIVLFLNVRLPTGSVIATQPPVPVTVLPVIVQLSNVKFSFVVNTPAPLPVDSKPPVIVRFLNVTATEVVVPDASLILNTRPVAVAALLP